MAKHLTDLYELPEIYDVLHQPGTGVELRGLERICRAWCGTDRARAGRTLTWLEPACGSGRLLRAAAAKGYRVIGFDLEAGMVRYAAARAREAGLRNVRVFAADMAEFSDPLGAGSVDFAFNTINSIRHLRTDAALIAHLRGMGRVLRPGGVYAVGISLSAYGIEQESEDVWRGRGRGMTVTQVVQYLPPRGERGRLRFEPVISHLVVRRGAEVRDIDSAYELRGYNRKQWRAALRRAGMTVSAIVDDKGRPTPEVEPGYAIWVLRGEGDGREKAREGGRAT